MTDMKFSELEEASDILKQIKIIDRQIAEIEKLAYQFANGRYSITFMLEAVDMVMKEKQDYERKATEPVPFAPGGIFSGIGFPFSIPKPQNDNPARKEYSQRIDEEIALQLLAVLVTTRQTRRIVLVRKLEKLGVST